MLAFALYDWLKALHVLAAVIWIGGGIMINILSFFALRSQLPGRRAEFAREVEWVGMRVFTPLSLVLLGLGFWLIYELDWGYPLWIVVGLVGFGLSFVIGAGFLGPQAGRIAKAVDTHGADSPQAEALIRRVLMVARIDLVILVFVIFDMVLKPT
jgi:uncharacterized membrane protein